MPHETIGDERLGVDLECEECHIRRSRGWYFGLDGGDVTIVVCNGDTPQQIRETLTSRIQQLGAGRGYAVKPVSIVVPMLQRGE